MKCGQILLANYPFTDQSGSKVRPILVVSADRYNQGEDLVVVPVSSAPEPDDSQAFLLREGESGFRQTGLRHTSAVKWTKPLTISKRVLQRRLGRLGSEPLSEIQSRIQGLFQKQSGQAQA